MLYALRILVILLLSQSVLAKEIILRSGKSLKLNEDTVVCEDRKPLKCKVDFDYVGKKYSVQAPNGRIQGRFDDKNEALEKAKSLVSFSVCEQVILNYDEK